MTKVMQFTPGQLYQGTDEQKSYTINVSKWFSAPTAACCRIWEGTTNRGGSNLQIASSASPGVTGTTVTTPCIIALRADVDYKVEIVVKQGGELLEGYFYLTGVTI